MNLLFNNHLVWNLFQGTPLRNTGGGKDDSWVYVMEIEKNRMGATDRVTQTVGGVWRPQTAKTTLTTKNPKLQISLKEK